MGGVFRRGCVLVIGGARSGKSRFALDFCNGLPGKRVFLATGRALDTEMEDRIRRHQEERPAHWHTVEEPVHLSRVIGELDGEDTVILVDCVTMWLNNLFMAHGEDQTAVDRAVSEMVETLSKIKGRAVLVTNEVGMGIVPERPSVRRYRDTAGKVNQLLGAVCRKVVLVVAGLPVVVKDT